MSTKPLIHQLLDEINENIINNSSLNKQEYIGHLIQRLQEFKKYKNFNLVLDIKKRKEKKFCDGYCYDNGQYKYPPSSLIIIEDHELHAYCQQCFIT